MKDDGKRAGLLTACLESACRVVQAVPRKLRNELTLRTDILLEDIEDSTVWVVEEWTTEQASNVAAAAQQVQSIEGKSPSADAGEVAAAVTELLLALEDVVASHVDQPEVLLTALQGGDAPETIVVVLEHALDVLDTLASSMPRKERKVAKALCERTEAALEHIDDTVMTQLSMCEASELSALVKCLCTVESMVVGEVERESCLETVSEALDELQRCSDDACAV